MEISIVTKNDKRLAITHFYYGVKSILEGSTKQIKLRELKHQLKQLTSNIKKKYQNSRYKDDIRKVLKEEYNKVVALAQDIAREKKFSNNQLLYDVFDGIPLIQGVPNHRAYDMVVKQDPERIIAWVFYPVISDDFDPLKSQIEAEQDFEIPCIDIKVIGKPLVPATVAPATTSKSQTKKPKQKVSTKIENLGKVLFSRKDQFKLRSEQEKDEIKGFLYEQNATTVKPHDILVLENLELAKKIYARVSNIDINPLSGGGYVHQFSEVVTHVLFRPLLELTTDYTGRPRPADLAGFTIRRPTSEELNEVLNIPEDGFPLGRLDYEGTSDVFKYPLIPEDTIYQSMLVAGVQGKGKTNFIKLLIRSLTTWQG